LWFFAAARINDGPPISIFSMISASDAFGSATVSAKGYSVFTTISTGRISCAATVSTCAGSSLRNRIPPKINGLRVFTRPSRISGKCVISSTDITAIPSSASVLAVFPVDTISQPILSSARANAAMPVLSYTLIRQRFFILILSTVPARLSDTVYVRFSARAVAIVPAYPPDRPLLFPAESRGLHRSLP
jgi:hypothetical protein